MHRADLIDTLLEAADSNKVSIKLGCSADASLLSDQYSIVIAADGVHSKTRNFLNPSQRKIVTLVTLPGAPLFPILLIIMMGLG